MKNSKNDSNQNKNRMHDHNQLINGDAMVAINGPLTNLYKTDLYINASPPEDYRKEYISKLIEKSRECFVQTEHYTLALAQLQSSNSIILSGRSGIGKTTLSYAICKFLSEERGYHFRFVKNPKGTDYDALRNLISKNFCEKEVVILDDFLGDTQFHLSNGDIAILEDFLAHIEVFEHKKFIFTTRKTILQQIQVKNEKIKSLIRLKLRQVDLDRWENEKDKLNMFFCYCKKYEIAKNLLHLYDSMAWNDNTFQKIISHPNFTPFMIMKAVKYCTEANQTDYETTIFDNLEHPNEIWEKEIKALDSPTRKYVNILYSLSNSGAVDWDILNNCFAKYMIATDGCPNISISDIQDNIKTLINRDEKYLEFIHPSLVEYLGEKITFSDREKIINSAIYLEQVERMDNTKERIYIKKLMELDDERKIPRIFDLKVLPMTIKLNNNTSHNFYNIIWIQYLKYLYEFKIVKEDHQPFVIEILKEILNQNSFPFLFSYRNIINVFKLKYDFHEILNCDQHLRLLFHYADACNIWNLIQRIANKDDRGYDFQKMDDYVQERLIDILKDIGEEKIAPSILNDIEEYTENELENYDEDDEIEYYEILEAVRDSILDDLDVESGKQEIQNVLKEHSIYNFDLKYVDEIGQSDYFEQMIEDAVVNCL